MFRWQDLFLKRKIMREKYFQTNNPETVKKNLLHEFLCNVRECPFEDMKELVEFVFHPTGDLNDSSYGNNPFFRALLSISDQLYVYDEFIQELGWLLNKNLDLVLPSSKRKKTFKHNSLYIDKIHEELIRTQKEFEVSDSFTNISSNLRKKEMLEKSPNKALLYNIIDNSNSIDKVFELFNQANNLEVKNNVVSSKYLLQLLQEMVDDGIILLKKRGNSDIIVKIV